MANKGTVDIQYNSVTFHNYVDTTAIEIAQVLVDDILPMAQELSPVDRGTNRRSITVETHRNPDGSIQGELFTQSGYGGYLELGHLVRGAGKGGFDVESSDYVQGRPYLYPSFMAFLPALLAAAKTGWVKMRSF